MPCVQACARKKPVRSDHDATGCHRDVPTGDKYRQVERCYDIPVGISERGKRKLKNPVSGKAHFSFKCVKPLGETLPL